MQTIFLLILLAFSGPASEPASVEESVLRDGLEAYFVFAQHPDLGKVLLVPDTRPPEATFHPSILDRIPPDSRGPLVRNFRESAGVRPAIPALRSHDPLIAAKEDLLSGDLYSWAKVRSYPGIQAVVEVSAPAVAPEQSWAVVRLVRHDPTSVTEYDFLLEKSDRDQWIMRLVSARGLE